MKNIATSFLLIKSLNIADICTITAIIPVLLGYYFVINGNPALAVAAMSAAFFLDTCDGYIARKKNISSELGKNLDSFVDALNYLSLTTLFMIRFLNFNIICTFFSVFMIISAGILRLSRYNINRTSSPNNYLHYVGMPVPYIQLAMMSIYLISSLLFEDFIYSTPFIALTISMLMISTIKFAKPSNYLPWYLLVATILCLTIINSLT